MQILKKISNLSLVIIFLIVTSGYTISTSFCKMSGKTTYSLVKKDCCCQSEEAVWNCCNNTTYFLNLDTKAVKTNVKIQVNDQFFLIPVQSFILSLLFPDTKYKETRYAKYSPPPLEENIPVIIQSFLI